MLTFTCGWVVVAVKLLAIAYAANDSIRARFWPGVGALVTALYLTIAWIGSLAPSRPPIPLSDVMRELWWLYPCALFFLSLGPMIFAFRKTTQIHPDDDRHKRYERAGFAFLANVLFDAAMLVILVVSLLLIARDP